MGFWEFASANPGYTFLGLLVIVGGIVGIVRAVCWGPYETCEEDDDG